MNENSHGLLRPYLPKGMERSHLTDEQVPQVADKPA